MNDPDRLPWPGPAQGTPDVTDRLGRALGGVVGGPVDVDALIVGSHRRAGVRRRRRQAAAGVLAAAVIAGGGTGIALGVLGRPDAATVVADGPASLGASLAGAPSGAAGPTVTCGPGQGSATPVNTGTGSTPAGSDLSISAGSTQTAASGPGTGISLSPAPPLGSPSPLPRTGAGLVVVPDSALLSGRLGAQALDLDLDVGQYAKVPTTSTSACRDEPLGLQYAVGGRSVQWSLVAGPDRSLSNAVRVFSGDGSLDQIDWLREHLDGCAGVWPGLRVIARDSAGEGSVLAVSTRAVPDSVMVLGAVRSGRATSGFQLVVSTGQPAEGAAMTERSAGQLGQNLLEEAYRALVSSGLGPASARDPSLAGS